MRRITGTLHEDQYTFLREIFRAKIVENIITHFMFKNFFFLNRAVYNNVKK
jgi:hypothetical protein